MLNNTLIRNLIVSLLVALLAPLLMPLLITAPDFNFNALTAVKVYLVVFVLLYLAGVVNEWLQAQARSSSYTSAYAENSARNISEAEREEGIVKWFNVNKGYGFIIRDCGGEVFVHFRSILGTGHRTLREGQRVKFVSVEGEKGLQAEEVSTLGR